MRHDFDSLALRLLTRCVFRLVLCAVNRTRATSTFLFARRSIHVWYYMYVSFLTHYEVTFKKTRREKNPTRKGGAPVTSSSSASGECG